MVPVLVKRAERALPDLSTGGIRNLTHGLKGARNPR